MATSAYSTPARLPLGARKGLLVAGLALVCAAAGSGDAPAIEAAGSAPQLRPTASARAKDPVKNLVRRLRFSRFKSNVRRLAAFGTRYWSTAGNEQPRDWIEAQLESYGYVVERHSFVASGRNGDEPPKRVDSVYATKVGLSRPDRMYIASAHMDRFNLDSPDQSSAPAPTSRNAARSRASSHRRVDTIARNTVVANADAVSWPGGNRWRGDTKQLGTEPARWQ